MANPFGDEAVEEAPNAFGDAPISASARKVSAPLQFAQKIAQGATFGWGDEISAGMVGAMAKMTGGDFKDAYGYALRNIRADEDAYSEQHPVLAGTAEIGGAVLAGGLMGSRTLGSGLSNLSALGKYGRIAAVGGVEGALYGAGSADQDRASEALKGFLVGAVAAPIGAKLIDLAVRGVGTTVSYASRKLASTPRDQAIRAIRAAAVAEGLDADDAVRMLDELGPQATIADLGENFRFLARAATDQSGTFKPEARALMNQRQFGQQQRLLEAAEVATGQSAGNFGVARQALVEARKQTASPFYQSAFLKDVKMTEGLQKILLRPELRSAMQRAQRMAANEGDEVGENLLKRIHYAKMDLDDRIGAAVRSGASNRARILSGLKEDLLREVDSLSPDYATARGIFSSDSRMIGAMDQGLELFKMSSDEMAEAMKGLSPSEKDLFRLGAVRAIRDHLDLMPEGHDATRRLLSTRAMRNKLGMIFTDPQEFIGKAIAESEFSRTRQILTGGSPTSERLMGQEALSGSIQSDLVTGVLSADPVAAGRALLGVFTKNPVTPEMVNELATLMLEQGASPAQIRRTFATPAFRQSIGSAYERVVVPAIAGAVAPAANAASD